MNARNKIFGYFFALTFVPAATIEGQNLYVASIGQGIATGTIGEYGLDGSTFNASLFSGLHIPWGIAISGNDLYVVNNGGTTIGEYTTAGATVNASLISGLDNPAAVAVSSVPEPSTIATAALGAAMFLLRSRRVRWPFRAWR
jgi:hypothetical protein